MEHPATIIILFSIFLLIGVSMSGCSDNAEPAEPGTAVPVTTAGPLFTAGDIVRSPGGTESPAWLVVSYDATGDSYARALIYKNADGTYGYRTSSSAETTKRAMMEKVYTVKITHVSVESVPTGAPTTATTAVTTTATTKATTTTTGTATTTTSSARPSVKAADPEEGEAGTSVTTEIKGADFASNLTAQLRHSGQENIKARTVSWYSSSSVTCTFDLPNTTKVGTWDIVITNSNGQSGELTNYFMIRGNGTQD